MARSYSNRGSVSSLLTGLALTVEAGQTSLPAPTLVTHGAAVPDGWTTSAGRMDDYALRISADGTVTIQSAHLWEWHGTTWDDLGLLNNGLDIVLTATQSFKQDLHHLDGSRLAVSATHPGVVGVTVTVTPRSIATD
jgi:hypothetical protein